MKRINIYLTVEQEEFLLSLKRESGASLAELVRRLITKKMGEVGYGREEIEFSADTGKSQGVI